MKRHQNEVEGMNCPKAARVVTKSSEKILRSLSWQHGSPALLLLGECTKKHYYSFTKHKAEFYRTP